MDILANPYIAGAIIGLLSMASFFFSDKPIGCSTAYARVSGMAAKLFMKDKINKNLFFMKFPAEVDWEVMLVIGVFIGAFLSFILSGESRVRIPDIWSLRFGNSLLLRVIAAFAGGVIMGFGARLAGGCTSGHGISGTLQLSVSSWIAVIMFFAAGIVTAGLIF
ncbi:MAG: YeeE/YedE thiosulfate transporter family protein [bacterium]|nr:YeeE/YedE thiosulfate transporter family protein [bacterium]